MSRPVKTIEGEATPDVDDLAYMDYLDELADIPTSHGFGMLLFKADPAAFRTGRDSWLASQPEDGIITREGFLAMTPYNRGYAVYMMGAREDQPNVPDEANPYEDGSENHAAWNRGERQAVIDTQDDP